MNKITALVMLLIGFPFLAYAEMEKIAIPCDTGICFYWWPKLPPIYGWHNDRDSNIMYSANVLAPDHNTFRDAETVMYAKSLFKPRIPDIKSINELIEQDKKRFVNSDNNITIKEVASIVTGDGKLFRSLTFIPSEKGNWERVSYGEEGDFYLIFTVSSRTKDGYFKTMKTYEDLINNYKEAP